MGAGQTTKYTDIIICIRGSSCFIIMGDGITSKLDVVFLYKILQNALIYF